MVNNKCFAISTKKSNIFYSLLSSDELNMIKLNSLNVCLHLKKLMQELKMEPFQQNHKID